MQRINMRLGWRRDLPDHRDLSLPKLEKVALPKSVHLADKFGDFPVYDQGNLGSCTANAIASAVVFTEIKEATDKTLTYPSRLFIYYGEREIEGSTESDSGAEIRNGMKVVNKQGYPQETSWPYDITRFRERPSDSVYAEAQKDHVLKYYRVLQTPYAMRACLAHGYPFIIGISVYDSFWNSSNGDIPVPSKDEPLDGGHAVLCTGYDDQSKMFDFRNSWGSGWGVNGYGRIPYSYLSEPNLSGDFWTIRKETTT